MRVANTQLYHPEHRRAAAWNVFNAEIKPDSKKEKKYGEGRHLPPSSPPSPVLTKILALLLPSLTPRLPLEVPLFKALYFLATQWPRRDAPRRRRRPINHTIGARERLRLAFEQWAQDGRLPTVDLACAATFTDPLQRSDSVPPSRHLVLLCPSTRGKGPLRSRRVSSLGFLRRFVSKPVVRSCAHRFLLRHPLVAQGGRKKLGRMPCRGLA